MNALEEEARAELYARLRKLILQDLTLHDALVRVRAEAEAEAEVPGTPEAMRTLRMLAWADFLLGDPFLPLQELRLVPNDGRGDEQ